MIYYTYSKGSAAMDQAVRGVSCWEVGKGQKDGGCCCQVAWMVRQIFTVWCLL